MKKEKILILTENYGEGHRQAACALYEAIQLQETNIEPVIVNYMQTAHPYTYPISQYLFHQMVKRYPSLYSYFYRKTNNRSVLSSMLTKFNASGFDRMVKSILEIDPKMVVSTIPLAAEVMSEMKARGLTNAAHVTVITDYANHRSWVHPYTDHYLVGSETVRRDLNHCGVSNSRISVTGIPIRPAFSMPYCPDALMKKYGLDSTLPTVLVMGGGWGLFEDGVNSLQVLEELPQCVQLIIVCGRNEKLKQQVSKVLHNSKHHVLLFGHVNYIPELMAVSDILLTKPGGLTVSEAVAMELPMLLYKPVLGQEEANAELLLQMGVAMQAKDNTDVIRILSEVLTNPEVLSALKSNAKRVQNKQAVFKALDIIMKMTPRDKLFWKEA